MNNLPSAATEASNPSSQGALQGAPKGALAQGCDHVVQFYEDDGYLCDIVARFLGEGLAANDSLIVIAAAAHIEEFKTRLRAMSVDVDAAQRSGQLTLLDARSVLFQILIDGMPDPDRFQEVVGGLVGRAAAPVRAFGEMVDLLWRDGNAQSAIRLEELWNELLRAHPLSLLCAYQLSNMYRADTSPNFHDVCTAHSRVLPAESHSSTSDMDTRLREISLLQLKAAGLESEIEHRKKLEAELRESLRRRGQIEAALRASNRDLDQFAYVASHDLKAPLRAIANLSHWIEEDQADHITPQSREFMALLRGRVARMESLIEGILTYSRAGRAVPVLETVDVARLLQEVIEIVQPPATTHVSIAADMPVLQTERVPLYQVFQNLLDNAVKYSRGPDARIAVAVRDEGDAYHFSVADSGPGIAPQFHDRIFKAFTTLQARDVVEGTGIGLSVVMKIATSRGGRVWVESSEGAGTTFHFLWPKQLESLELPA